MFIGHLSLVPSHEHWCLGRASWRWTFYGFSNERHHSGEAAHEGVGLQGEDETMVRRRTHFRSRCCKFITTRVVASESRGVWSATPVHRGHNSSDDSLHLMALSRALNPSSLIGESSGKWGASRKGRWASHPSYFEATSSMWPASCSIQDILPSFLYCTSTIHSTRYCMKEILSCKTLNICICPPSPVK